MLEIQAKLHRWANDDPGRRFDDLFNLAPAVSALLSIAGLGPVIAPIAACSPSRSMLLMTQSPSASYALGRSIVGTIGADGAGPPAVLVGARRTDGLASAVAADAETGRWPFGDV